MTTIVVADDHPVVRQGLRAVLEAEPGFSVIGEAGDGRHAVELVDRLRPHILILDLMMPGLSGVEVSRQVRQRSPVTRVVILSMYDNEAYVLEGLRSGAAAYVLKGAGAAELVHAVYEVMAGRRYLSPPLSERAIETYLGKATEAPAAPHEALTTREREVLYLAIDGLSNSEVAARLGVSPRTVETHRANLMRKLGVQNQTELIRYALRHRLIPSE